MHVSLNFLLVLCFLNLKIAYVGTSTSENNVKKIRELDEVLSNVSNYVDYEIKTYIDNLINFALKLFLYIAEETNNNFIYSPYSVLLSLSAIVEGSEDRKNIDDVLGLPKDRCYKKRYYELIQSQTTSCLDVTFIKTQALVIDQNLHLNPNWHAYVPAQFQQDILLSPIKRFPAAAAYAIRQVTNVQLQGLNLTGNSVLLDSLEYTGLWQRTFPELLLKQPFYNNVGEQIGWVDLMKTKIRAELSCTNENGIIIKAIALPVGADGRYRMVIAKYEGKSDFIKSVRSLDKNIVKTVIENLKESKIPIEVQIPKFGLDIELDMRKFLEKIGISSLWTNPSVTRLVIINHIIYNELIFLIQ